MDPFWVVVGVCLDHSPLDGFILFLGSAMCHCRLEPPQGVVWSVPGKQFWTFRSSPPQGALPFLGGFIFWWPSRHQTGSKVEKKSKNSLSFSSLVGWAIASSRCQRRIRRGLQQINGEGCGLKALPDLQGSLTIWEDAALRPPKRTKDTPRACYFSTAVPKSRVWVLASLNILGNAQFAKKCPIGRPDCWGSAPPPGS